MPGKDESGKLDPVPHHHASGFEPKPAHHEGGIGPKPKHRAKLPKRLLHHVAHPSRKLAILGAGVVAAAAIGGVALAGFALPNAHKKPSSSSSKTALHLSPSSGRQQLQVGLSFPAGLADPPNTVVMYDPSTHIKYPIHAIPGTGGPGGFKFVTPYEPCQQARQATQAKPPVNGKADSSIALVVEILGPDGQPLPGVKPATFKLKCKRGAMAVYADPAAPASVVADGATTATLTVNAEEVAVDTGGVPAGGFNPGAPGGVVLTPISGLKVSFTTDLGTLSAPSAVTGAGGSATVTITSTVAGIATITPVITNPVKQWNLVDAVNSIVSPKTAPNSPAAALTVRFVPKIVSVTQNFDGQSTTFDQVSVGRTDLKNLTFTWAVVYPGAVCGVLVGAPSGLSETGNGYQHEGCDPNAYEPAVRMSVVVKDPAGDSASCVFSARGLEGQGAVLPPGC